MKIRRKGFWINIEIKGLSIYGGYTTQIGLCVQWSRTNIQIELPFYWLNFRWKCDTD